jgi:hypothetical protein
MTQRIAYVKDIRFLGYPMKGRLGTVTKTAVNPRTKELNHYIKWDGINGHLQVMGWKSFNVNTFPILS